MEPWSSLELMWMVAAAGISVAGFTALLSPAISDCLNDLVKYGKSRSKERSNFQKLIEVPKRWFSHFYMTAVVTTSMALVFVMGLYLAGAQPPSWLRQLLRMLAFPRSEASIGELSVVLTATLIWCNSVRRLLESLFVSVYSETQMNILHFAAGMGFYVLMPLTLLAESPGFLTSKASAVDWSSISATQTLGIVLFLWCGYCQHQCFVVLAQMRRNHLGNITNYAHGIPYGGFFDSVSCPHFLFEVLLYLSFFLTLDASHHVWRLILAFVVSNQIIAALITHRWYKERFGDSYPPHRKAIIPFIL